MLSIPRFSSIEIVTGRLDKLQNGNFHWSFQFLIIPMILEHINAFRPVYDVVFP